jgi:hypothetical protein
VRTLQLGICVYANWTAHVSEQGAALKHAADQKAHKATISEQFEHYVLYAMQQLSSVTAVLNSAGSGMAAY